MFLYDNMIKAELQTEDGFLIVSIKQEPLLTNVKTEPEENDIYSTSVQQNTKTEIATNVQSEVSDVLLTHTGEKNFKCDMCDKKFTLSGQLNRHIRTVHDKVKAFPCPHCPYEAASSSDLKRHILTHTGEKNLKCNICDKKFTLNSNLKVHIRSVHNKVKAFPCPHCPHKAIHSGNLKAHILTHTGEKNFKCDICGKMFTHNGQLNVHIRTVHDKVRAFPCPHCPHKAIQSGNLKAHILTHTGEKNFKCDMCNKKFAQSSSLKLHIRTVHESIRAFPCPHCPHKATQRGNLKAHIRTHTREKNLKPKST